MIYKHNNTCVSVDKIDMLKRFTTNTCKMPVIQLYMTGPFEPLKYYIETIKLEIKQAVKQGNLKILL